MTLNYRSTYAEVNLKNLKSNFIYLKSLVVEGGFICPMVKANAYGHGDIEVVRALSEVGAENFGVALIEEAIKLRDAGIKKNILMFGVFDLIGSKAIIEYNIIPVLSLWEQLYNLKDILKSDQVLPVYLKFNTGMNRLGFSSSDAKKLYDFFKFDRNFKLLGLCTHLASGQDLNLENSFSQKQINDFEAIKNIFKDFAGLNFHVFNSAAHFQIPKNEKSLSVRSGIGLYGFGIPEDFKVKLKPVMNLYSQIVKVQNVQKDHSVSYGRKWIAQKDSKVGVVSIGYADGYSRQFSNQGFMLCKGIKQSVVGTVCMDYTMIDITNLFKIYRDSLPGCKVMVFGEDEEGRIDVDEISDLIGTISYETLTCIGPRVPRIYKYD